VLSDSGGGGTETAQFGRRRAAVERARSPRLWPPPGRPANKADRPRRSDCEQPAARKSIKLTRAPPNRGRRGSSRDGPIGRARTAVSQFMVATGGAGRTGQGGGRNNCATTVGRRLAELDRSNGAASNSELVWLLGPPPTRRFDPIVFSGGHFMFRRRRQPKHKVGCGLCLASRRRGAEKRLRPTSGGAHLCAR
jgi:hypothetical protein